LSTLAAAAIPSFFGRVIDALATPIAGFDQRQKLFSETRGLVAISVLNALFSFVRGYLFDLAGERVVARLRKRLFASLLAQETGFFDQAQTGDLVSRISGDTSILRDAVTGNISSSLRLSATIIGGIAYLFVLSWKLTLAVLAVVPAIALLARFYGAYTRELSKKTREAIAESTTVAEETLSSLRTVRSFANEPLQQLAFDTKIDASYSLGIKSALATALFSGLTSAAVAVAFVAVLFYGGTLVVDRESA
jgi:ABC-type multidrug transport system fused ATPase/permease subunit